jgi:hypothetical protein
MNPVRRDNPKTLARASPLPGLPQKSDEPPEIRIRYRYIRGDKALSRLVEHTHPFMVV